MKAALLEAGKLQVRDLPVPEPGNDEALIRISAAGVCHSDLGLVRHDIGTDPLDIPLGHEAIGIVEALGPGADRFVALGDRVILGLGAAGGDRWCGACRACLRGDTPYCAQNRPVLGLFSEQFAINAKALVKLPDSVSDLEAPLACGGLTAYGAVKKLSKFDVAPGRSVAVIGAAGGLGHYAVQLANAFGYQVVGVDIGEERLEFVRSLGARIAVGPDDALEVVRKEIGGVDASLVFSASMAGYRLGWDLLGLGGLLVGVGRIPSRDGLFELDFGQVTMKNATITSSLVGNIQDMRDLIDLVAAGKVKSHVGRTGSLSELEQIFDEFEAHQILGRAVITNLAG